MSLANARIERIETIPLRVAMEREASGSTLTLTHRCTIVTRIFTDIGVVGECFNGNDDDIQASIIKLIHAELEPRIKGMRLAAIETPSMPLPGEKRLRCGSVSPGSPGRGRRAPCKTTSSCTQ